MNLLCFVFNDPVDFADAIGLEPIGFPEIPWWSGRYVRPLVPRVLWAYIAAAELWAITKLAEQGNDYLDEWDAKMEYRNGPTVCPEGESPELVKYVIIKKYSSLTLGVTSVGVFTGWAWHQVDHIKTYECCACPGKLISDTGLVDQPGFPITCVNTCLWGLIWVKDVIYYKEQTQEWSCSKNVVTPYP